MSAKISGATELVAYLTRLQTDIPKAVDQLLISEVEVRKLDDIAKDTVQRVVYDAVPPGDYARTGNLKDSVSAAVISHQPASVGLVIDPAIAPAIAGQARGQVGYAQFMLPEFSNDSFLQHTVPETLPRDFATPLQQVFADVIHQDAVDVIEQELRK